MRCSNPIPLLFLILLPSGLVGQNCPKLETALTYIESNLVADMYFSDEFGKDEIRAPLIWIMDEKIPIDFKRFGIEVKSLLKVNEVINTNEKLKQKTIRSDANYLLFSSDIVNNRLMVELVNNRDPFFNVPNAKTEYDKWSRMNGGMSYLFTYNDKGCIIQIVKKYVFND